ncbi:MAG: tetratricopeptide repeat protein [Acidobacteria bacterium]|nr:tetratricopeptide repeat protein [Acidobacteriota bacterium]
MSERRECVVMGCALSLALCIIGSAPPLRAQDTKSDTIQQIGWEISTGHIHSALADARQAVEEYPNSAILMHLLAVAESKNDLEDEARESFRKAIRLDPTIPQDYYDLALLDMQAGDYAEATKMIQTYLQVSPQNAKAHLMLGIAYRKQNKDQFAIEQLKQAIAALPGLPLAHYNLGKIYASQGNNKAALDEYRKELGVNPEFYDVYCSAGNAELAEKNFKSAEALFRRGTELKPLAYQAYYGLARVFLAQNQLPEAESQTLWAFSADSGSAAASASSASLPLGFRLRSL